MKKLKHVKNFESFENRLIGESNELLGEIVATCEDILLELKDEDFKTKIYCHKLDSTDPQYLGTVSRTKGTYGYKKDNSILFHISYNRQFEYSGVEETIERLKSYLGDFEYKIEFMSHGRPTEEPTIESSIDETDPGMPITTQDLIELPHGINRFTPNRIYYLVFRFKKY